MDTQTQTPSTQQAPVQAQTAVFAQELQKENMAKKSTTLFIPLIVVAIILGVGTGVAGAVLTSPKESAQQTAAKPTKEGTQTQQTGDVAVKVGQIVGAKDASNFKDTVEGVLVAGGIGSEGSHHIVRPGGASQNVYLTSSVMDLKLFEGAKVKVSGETFKGQKAGWLMDVGRVEVEELNAPLPDGAKPAKTAEQGDF